MANLSYTIKEELKRTIENRHIDIDKIQLPVELIEPYETGFWHSMDKVIDHPLWRKV